MNLFARYRAVPLATRLFAALVAGAVTGLLVGARVEVLAPLGDVLVITLRVLAPFVVAIFVLASVSGTTCLSVGGAGIRALVAYAVLAGIGAAVGTAFAGSIWTSRPPFGLPLASVASIRTWGELGAAWAGPALRSLDAAVVFVLVVSVPLALAIGVWRDARPLGAGMRVHRALQRAAGALTRAVTVVMEYAPVATFALAAVAFGSVGGATGQWMASAFATVYGAQVVVGGLVLAMVGALGHRVLGFLAGTSAALLTALVTGSSAASLPVELQAAEQALRVPPANARFALPLGMAVSKVGTTVFLAALTVVAGVLAGHAVDAPWLVRIALLATVTGMVTPPIPGGGYLMLGVIFGQLGIPVALVPLLIGIPFIGKLNTPLNTLGRLGCLLLLDLRTTVPDSPPEPGIGV